VSVERTFSRDNVVIGECLQVSLAVSVSPPSPQVFILSENSPPEVRVLSACWQGQPIATKVDGISCQWLLGWPEPLQNGVLQYVVEVLSTTSQNAIWQGQILLPGDSSLPISGASQLRLDASPLPMPIFSPADGSEFTAVLTVELFCQEFPEEIFFAFGEDSALEDWHWYEGPFTISESQILQAEVWNASGEFGPRNTARYYRNAESCCSLQLGWNLLGNDLLLSSGEQSKLLERKLWRLSSLNRGWEMATSIDSGQAYFIFAHKPELIIWRGRQPLPQRQQAYSPGWRLRVASDAEDIGIDTSYWLWQSECYKQQKTERLRPGTAFWHYFID